MIRPGVQRIDLRDPVQQRETNSLGTLLGTIGNVGETYRGYTKEKELSDFLRELEMDDEQVAISKIDKRIKEIDNELNPFSDKVKKVANTMLPKELVWNLDDIRNPQQAVEAPQQTVEVPVPSAQQLAEQQMRGYRPSFPSRLPATLNTVK